MNLLVPAFNISLIVTVFSFALTAQRFDDVRYLWHRPRLLIVSLLAMFVVTPVAALAIAMTFDIPISAQVAIVALSFSMIPPLLPQKEIAAGGDERYGIGLVMYVAVLAPLGITALVHLLGRVMDRPYGVPPGEIAATVAGLVVLPLIAGLVFGRIWPGATAAIQATAPKIAASVTGVAVIVFLVLTASVVWDYVTGWTLVAAAAFNVVSLGIGHVLGGPDRRQAVVLAMSCAGRHPAIAMTIAATNYPGENFAAAVILVLVLNGVLTPLYLKLVDRSVGEQPAELGRSGSPLDGPPVRSTPHDEDGE
jgi:BASS family bile acid:Na+ symporter